MHTKNSNLQPSFKRRAISAAFASLLAIIPAASSQAGILTMADPLAGGINYKATLQLGAVDSASFMRHVGAWSWEDNDRTLEFGTPVGWTHTSDWVALTLDAPTTLTLRMERQTGVPTGPTTFASVTDMYPSFTIWSNWDNDDGDLHVYNNNGPVDWAEDLVYLSHVNNSTETFAEASWLLPAGNYTIVLGSNTPETETNTVKQGYLATFTTVPEPSSTLFIVSGLAALGVRFRTRRNSWK